MRVAVIAPHPDDEVLGCGGVMARHAAEGDEVFVIVVTRGVVTLPVPVSWPSAIWIDLGAGAKPARVSARLAASASGTK